MLFVLQAMIAAVDKATALHHLTKQIPFSVFALRVKLIRLSQGVQYRT